MSTAINVICLDRPGMLRDIAGVVAKMGGNIVYTQQFVVERGVNQGQGIALHGSRWIRRGVGGDGERA